MRQDPAFLSTLALLGALTGPTAARAQDPAAPAAPLPPAAETAADPAPPAAAEPAPEPTAPTAATSSPAAPPAPPAGGEAAAPAAPPAPAEERDDPVAGWFRIDSDLLALQLWVGATHSLGPLDVATDIYVTSGTFAELDLGPSFTVPFGDGNSFIATPMAGIGFDWSQRRAVSLIAPQLFLYLTAGPVYLESWTQAFFNSVFVDDATDSLYLRDFLLFKLSDTIAVGPHVEATLDLSGGGDPLLSLPVAGAVSLSYGEGNTLLLALGYETVEDARQVVTGVDETDPANPIELYAERGVAGRFTFTRLW